MLRTATVLYAPQTHLSQTAAKFGILQIPVASSVELGRTPSKSAADSLLVGDGSA